jgi:putative PEP-CTERM system histidine kinase
MNLGSALCFFAAVFNAGLAVAVVLRRHRSAGGWFFTLGMLVLAAECFFAGRTLSASSVPEIQAASESLLRTGVLIPFTWIGFSLTYLRGDWKYYLKRWWLPVTMALLVPVALTTGVAGDLLTVEISTAESWQARFKPAAIGINATILLAAIAVLYNLERTLSGAVGTNRWKIKFALLGIGVVFGPRIYTRSHALIFYGVDAHCAFVDAGGVLVGGVLMLIAFLRQGFATTDLYLSRSVIQSSVTLILAGGYLLAVGVFAKWAAALGGGIQLPALIMLSGGASLAILLMSDRLRQKLRSFVERNFRRPHHDSRGLWSAFTALLSGASDQRSYAASAANLLAGPFQVLSVTVWIHDEGADSLVPAASTATPDGGSPDGPTGALSPAGPLLEALRAAGKPFDLETLAEHRLDPLRAAAPGRFPKGGHRFCLPLLAGDRVLGAVTLADRVNGQPYSAEDLDLLHCISDQIAAGLLRFQLTEEVARSREFEAFQAMSTFLVHDLKNAASSLTLMLKNLPVHFDNPDFRRDALQALGSSVSRINQITSRLGTLRKKLEVKAVETDLNALIREVLTSVPLPENIQLVQELQPVPPVPADPELMGNAVTNLLINAREAMPPGGGRITVETSVNGKQAIISVADSGCGMSPAFVRNSLFRPFQTTKNTGLGIGMFQCRAIVHAHSGSLQVESEPGEGTTIRVLLPLQPSVS